MLSTVAERQHRNVGSSMPRRVRPVSIGIGSPDEDIMTRSWVCLGGAETADVSRWRKQAIDWLEADLTAWSKILESGSPQVRQSITQTLQHWKAESDLAGIRDEPALGKLPEAEQKACRALWAEVEALLAKAKAHEGSTK